MGQSLLAGCPASSFRPSTMHCEKAELLILSRRHIFFLLIYLDPATASFSQPKQSLDTIILSNFENFTFFSRGTSILISENYPTITLKIN
jgi:hypothetical protein